MESVSSSSISEEEVFTSLVKFVNPSGGNHPLSHFTKREDLVLTVYIFPFEPRRKASFYMKKHWLVSSRAYVPTLAQFKKRITKNSEQIILNTMIGYAFG